MKLVKISILGLALAIAPAAMADTIYGVLKVDGTGVNGGAAVNVTQNGSNVAFNVSPSPGTVVSGTDTFSYKLTTGELVSYDPNDNNKSIKLSTLSTLHPGLLLTVGPYTVYITSASNIVAGAGGNPGAKGSFDAVGYITDDGGATRTPVTVNWLSATKGAGKVNFLTTITAAPTPEPGSLALLGTGVVGIAGALRRKLKLS